MKWAVRDMAVLGWVALCAFGCAETPNVGPPVVREEAVPQVVSNHEDLRVYVNEYPLIYEDPESFLLEVFFENRGPSPLIILPSLIRRQYSPMDESGVVTYVPRSDPAPSSWQGAFALQPQETRVVTLAGMEDGDGVWELDKGFYRLSVRYVVTDDVALNGEHRGGEIETKEGVLWVGEQESHELTVRYEPAAEEEPARDAAAPAPLDEGRAGDARF